MTRTRQSTNTTSTDGWALFDVSRAPRPFTLEPRCLLDAAMAATVAEEVESEPDPKVQQTVAAALTAPDADSEPATPDLPRTAEPAVSQLVFVDPSVDGHETIVAAASATPGAQVIVLDPTRDGLVQIADATQHHQDLAAIHIVSHGDSGELIIGGASVTTQTIQGADGELFARIGASLGEHGDLLIYGCDIAGLPDGEAFVSALADVTGADVAASDDLTGASARGGDWTLEFRTGGIEAETLALQDESFDALLSIAPVADLDADGSTGLSGTGFTTVFQSNGAPISITDLDPSITDADDTALLQMQIAVANVGDGVRERLIFAGDASTSLTVTLEADSLNNRITVNGTEFDVDYVGGVFSIANNAGGTAALGDFEALLAGIEYQNTDPTPTSGGRTLDITVIDASLDASASARATVIVSAGGTPDISLNGVFAFGGSYATWFFNDPGDPFRGDPITPGLVSSTVDAAPGSGLSMTDDFTRLVVSDVQATTFADAVANDEFVELSFTTDPSSNPLLLFEGLIRRVGSNEIPDVANEYNYKLGMQVSANASFEDAVTIFEEREMTDPGDSVTDNVDWGGKDWITKPGESYFFRFYFYDVTSPIGEAVIDDIGFLALEVTRDFARTFNEGDAPVLVSATDGFVNDFTESDIIEMSIVAADLGEPDQEILRVGGTNFTLDTDQLTPITTVIGGTSIDITYDATSQTFTLVESSSGTMADADLGTLINSITYSNASTEPTAGDRTFTFTVTDGQNVSPEAVSTITVIPDPSPTLDLDADDSEGTGGADFAVTFTEGDPAAGIAHTDADVVDLDSTEIILTTIAVGGVADGANEQLILNGDAGTTVSVSLGAASLDNNVIVNGNVFDVDFDGTNFSITLSSGANATHADVEKFIAGLTYENTAPNLTEGDRTFDFVVTDPDGNVSNTARSTVTVVGVNEAPTADDDFITTTEDSFVIALNDSSEDILVGDNDPDGDPLSITHINGNPYTPGDLITLPSGALLSVNSNGSYVYNPFGQFDGLDDGESATDSFTYTVDDLITGTATATVTITITGANDAPVSADAEVTTTEDTDHVFVLSEFPFTDVDVEALILIRFDTLPNNGALLVDGVEATAPFTLTEQDVIDGRVVFRPAPDENGLTYATFDFAVGDGTDFSGTNTMTVHVNPTDDPPTATDDGDSFTGATVVVDVLANDSDPDGSLDVTSVVITSNPAGSTLAGDGKTLTVPGEGEWTVESTFGRIQFTPEAGFTGLPTAITYTVDDNAATTSNAATVTLTDDAPPVAVDDTEDFDGTPTVVAVVDNDDAGEPVDPTSVRITSNPAGTTLFPNGKTLEVPGEGTWTVDLTSGEITFTPDPGFTGLPTPIDYTVEDQNGNVSNTATVTLNDTIAPLAVDDQDTFDGSAVTVSVTANDETGEPVVPATVAITSNPVGTTLSGDARTLTVPGEGEWTVDESTGDITFTPEPGFTGLPTAITYVAEDAQGNVSNTATVSLLDDAAPVAVDDTENFTGAAVIVDVTDNDEDGEPVDGTTVLIISNPPGTTLSPDGKTLTVPDEGTWTVDGVSGAITFTPEAGFTGQPTAITYVVDDSSGNTSNLATVSLTDAAPPAAVDDTEVFTGSPITVDVPSNDDVGEPVDLTSVVITSNPPGTTLSGDGKTLTVPGQGVWTVDAVEGDITFTPNVGFTDLPTAITYTVDDAAGNTSNTATVTLSDGALPLALPDVDDFAGVAVVVDVIDNDQGGETVDPTTVVIVDPPPGATLAGDGKTLTVPTEGEWTVDALSGEITFTPEAGFTDTPTVIRYTVQDTDGNASTAVTVTLNDVAAPLAADDTGSFTGTPVTVDVVANDETGESVDPTTVVITSNPPGTTLAGDGKALTVPGEGAWVVDPVTGEIEFTPEAGFTDRPTAITYTVEDPEGNVSNPATVSLSDDVAPLAEDDTDAFNGVAITVDVVDNDDAGEVVDQTTVAIISNPAGSTLSVDGRTLTVPGQGEWAVSAVTGAITFTPEAGFISAPTPIEYTVEDTDGNVSNAATVTLTADTVPTAIDDNDTFTGAPITVDVLSNDVGSEPLVATTVVITSNPAGSTLAVDGKTLTVPGEGVWTVDPVNGEVTFGPDAGFTGLPTPITYTVEDTDSETSNAASIVLADALAPVAEDDTGSFTGVDVTVDVTDNDEAGEPVDPTTVVITSNPAGTTLAGDGKTLTVPGEGEWSVNTTSGQITFAPESGFTGLPTAITYTVEDLSGNGSNVATVSLTDDADPVAVDDTEVFAGTPVVVDVTDNDDDGEAVDPTTVVILSAPAGATLAPDGKTLTVPSEGEWSVDLASGDITFTPASGFTGEPTPITYQVDDTLGNTSNAATVTLTDGVAPVAVDDTDSFTGIPITVDVTQNDDDGEPVEETTVVIVSNPVGSTLAPDGKTLTVPTEGEWTVDGAGQITFTPEVGFTEEPTPIDYTVEDAAGNVSNAATLTLVDSAFPVARNDTDDFAGTPITVDVLSNDEPMVASTVVITSNPAGTTLASDGKTLTVPNEGEWTVDPTSGEITFTPEAGFTGIPTPITYQAEDAGTLESNVATVTLNDTAAPVATADVETFSGLPVTIEVTDNDEGGEPVAPDSVVITSNPAGTTLAGDGKTLTVPGEGAWTVQAVTGEITFTPEAGFTGLPTPIEYQVEDTSGNTATPVSVTLLDAVVPAAVDDTDVFTGVAITLDVTSNDEDGEPVDAASVVITSALAGSTLAPDGKTLTVPDQGEWTVHAVSGEVTFTPEAGFTGLPTPITYTVNDTSGNTSNVANVTLSDGAAPVAADDSSPFTGSPVVVDVTDNDDAGESIDPTSVVITSNPAGSTLAPDGKTLTVPGEGVWTVDLAGEITFTPEADFTGQPTAITYTVDDPAGNTSNVATVSLPDAAAPVAVDDVGVLTGAPVTVDLPANDAAGEPLDLTSALIVSNPAGSTLSVDGRTLTVPGEGEWDVDPISGEVIFTPELGFAGAPTPIDYTIADLAGNVSDPATVRVVDNSVPLADDDNGTFLGAPITLDILANDDGGGTVDPTTVVFVSPPVGATLAPDGKSLTVPSQGTWTISPVTGEATFTPEAGFAETPTPVTYTVENFNGDVTAAATVTLLDGAPPIAADDPVTSSERIVTVDVVANDSRGPVVPASVQIVNPPAGSVLAPDGKTLTVAGEGVWTVDPVTGMIRFAPNSGFDDNPTSIQYSVEDAAGNAATARVTITYTFASPAPVAASFVVLPDAPGGPELDAPPAPPRTSIQVDGIIIAVVRDISDLGSLPSIEANGAVVRAVNGIASLGGTRVSLEAPGIILDVVAQLRERAERERPDHRPTSDKLGSWAPNDLRGYSLRFHTDETRSGETGPRTDATARSGEQLALESLIDGSILYVEIKFEVEGLPTDKVKYYGAELLDGRPLPDWLTIHRYEGLMLGELPVDAEALSIKVWVILDDGRYVERQVWFDAQTGQLRPLRDANADAPAPDSPAPVKEKIEVETDKRQREMQALATALMS